MGWKMERQYGNDYVSHLEHWHAIHLVVFSPRAGRLRVGCIGYYTLTCCLKLEDDDEFRIVESAINRLPPLARSSEASVGPLKSWEEAVTATRCTSARLRLWNAARAGTSQELENDVELERTVHDVHVWT